MSGAFADENLDVVYRHELISRSGTGGCGFHLRTGLEVLPHWHMMREAVGPLYVGFECGRKVDLSGHHVKLRRWQGCALLRDIADTGTCGSGRRNCGLGEICRLPGVSSLGEIDMTGWVLGIVGVRAEGVWEFGIMGLICQHGPATKAICEEGRKRETCGDDGGAGGGVAAGVRDRGCNIRGTGVADDLRKPEKVDVPGIKRQGRQWRKYFIVLFIYRLTTLMKATTNLFEPHLPAGRRGRHIGT